MIHRNNHHDLDTDLNLEIQGGSITFLIDVAATRLRAVETEENICEHVYLK